MPHTRCRNFDDDGNELRGGCRRNDCEYVHPTDPKWPWARKYEHNNRGRGTGRGRGGGKGRGETRTMQWGHPPNLNVPSTDPAAIASTSSGVARSDWGNADYKGTSTGSRPDRTDAQDGWRTQQWGGSSGDVISGWSDTSGDKEGKDTTGNGGWGDGGGSGWGSSGNGWETSGGNAWGTNESNSLKSGGKDLQGNGNTGWGASQGNGWGTSDGNGWGTGGATDGIRKDSEQKRSNGDTGSRSRGLKAGIAPTMNPERSKETTKSSGTTVVMETAMPMPIPLPSTKPSGSRPSPMQTPNTPHAPLEIRTAPLEDTAEPSPTIIIPTSSGPPRGGLTRAQVYSSSIRHIQNAIRLQLQLEAAQAAVDRWSLTESSAQYQRVSPATKKLFSAKKSDLHKNSTKIANQLKIAIKALSDLPDLCTPSGKAYPDVNENQIMEYTAQLKDWIGKLQLGNRIVPPSPSPENRPLRSQDGQPWTWEHIKDSFDGLERLADNFAEQIYIKKFTNMNDIMDPNEKIVALLDAHFERENSKAALAGQRADALVRNADTVGNELVQKATLAAQLFIKVQHNEAELERLRDEKKQRDTINFKIEGYLKKFEDWRREDSLQIQELTDQIMYLHTLRPPTPPPFSIEDIRPKIRELVIDKLENEIAPVLDQFRAACTQNNERFMKELYKKLKPTLELTANICYRAQGEAL